MVHQFQAQMKTHPSKYIKYMTKHPHAFNASTFKALGEAEEREANARTPLPSKSGIGYWTGVLRKGCSKEFEVLESTVNHANDTFKVADWDTFFGTLVKSLGVVEKCTGPGAPRYLFCICCDGAPTEKNMGLVSLAGRQCDSRIYKCAFDIINMTPQLMRGAAGYEDALRKDAETMQCHL